MARGKAFLYLLTTCSLMASAHAAAQTAPAAPATQDTTSNRADQEIVVTAQRRSERVLDVPVSVAVVDAGQLNRQNVSTLYDLGQVTPSLDIGQQNNVGGAGAIRGIGTTSANLGAVASVGIVVDQVSQGNVNLSDIFDVARIEVLKGPQGTLFGLTTSAGVINITTNAPDPTHFLANFRTQISGTNFAGSVFGRQLLQGMVNVPLTDNSAARLSASGELRQGPDRDVTNNRLTAVDHLALRGRYLWTPSDKLTLNVIGDYSYGYQSNSGDFLTLINLPAAETAQVATCGVTPAVGNRNFCVADQYHSTSNTYGISAQMDYDLGPATLTSISSYRRNTSNNTGQDIFRADPLALRIVVNGPQPLAINLFTQELRVSSAQGSRLEYTFGAFASSQVTDSLSAGQTFTLGVAPGVRIPLFTTLAATNHTLDRSVAMFGQTTLHMTDRLSLITGARITSASLENDRYDPNAIAQGVAPASNQTYSTLAFSYKAGLQYKIAPDSMLYGTYSKGYKGAQIALPSLPYAPYVVYPELPTDIEFGYKRKLVGGLLLDTNLFYETVHNYQTQSCTYDVATSLTSCAQANISRVISKGAEVDVFGHVSRALSLSAGVIYQSVKYPTGYIGSDGSDLSGQQLAMDPKWKATFSASYEKPINDNYTGFASLNVVYKTRTQYGADMYPTESYHPHAMVGGQIGAKFLHEKLKAYVFVTNLFNEHEPQALNANFANAGPTGTAAVYGPNSFRQVGLGLETNF